MPPSALSRSNHALAPSRGPVKVLPPTGLVALVTMPTRTGVAPLGAGAFVRPCSKSLSGSRLPQAVPARSSSTAAAVSAAGERRSRGIPAHADQCAQGVDGDLPGAVLLDGRTGGVRQRGRA